MSHLRDIPILVVEGTDDLFTIAELLQRYGVDMSEGQRPFEIKVAKDPKTKAEGVVPLIALMADAIRNAIGKPIGFVLDVDIRAADRWREVCAVLQPLGVSPPQNCPSTGYTGLLPDRQVPFGVWMMPDCVSDHGKLEHLIKSLIPAEDRIHPLATNSTDEAKRLGALFRPVDRDKAIVHAWLSWQRDPGVPFGTAINREFLGKDSPEARAFLLWLKQLFTLDALVVP